MLRRDFFQKTGLAGLAAWVSATPLARSLASEEHEQIFPDTASMKTDPVLLKPARLRPGASVALIAPGSPLSDERIAKAHANLETLGLKGVEGRYIHEEYGYLAGNDKQRLADLHWAFRDKSVDAVWCLRGGYGCARLLPMIDYELVRQNPKPFIGYSDVTALHLAFQQRIGLTTFHGPVAASTIPEDAVKHFKAVLMDAASAHRIDFTEPGRLGPKERDPQPFTIREGKAAGILTGGNLSLLAALAGTPDSPRFAGKIVFIEDVEEEPYRIDRMLTQLLQATDLAKAAGIALGVFSDCKPDGKEPSLTLMQTLRDRLAWLKMPVAYGFPCGHVSYQATLPLGVKATLDAGAGRLVLGERAVG